MVGTKEKVVIGVAALATMIGTAIVLSAKEAAAQETGSLAGAVIDVVTGLPIQDVTVEARDKSTFTDANGQWSLTGLPVGNVTVTFNAPGYGPFTSIYSVVAGVQTTVGDIGLTPKIITLSVTATPDTGFAPLTVGFETSPCCAAPYSFDWNFGDGTPNVPHQNPNHTYSNPGTYVATCTMTDGLGRTLSKTVTVTVQAAEGSVAGRIVDSSTGSPLAGASVSVDGYSATSDGSGNFSIANIPSGSYTLTVSSPNYNPATQAVTVVAGQITSMKESALLRSYVGEVSLPPEVSPLTVNITGTPVSGEAPLVVGFESSACCKAPYDFLWNLGDGNNSIYQNPVHVYDVPGIYAVTLRVIDALGRTKISSVLNVTVTSPEPPPLQPPSLLLSVSPLSGDAPLSIVANVIASGGTPPYIYLWDQGENTVSINRIYISAGTYNVSCTVFDANGLSAFRTQQIIVNDPGGPPPDGGLDCWWPGEPAQTGTYVDVSCDPTVINSGGTWPGGWLFQSFDLISVLNAHPGAGPYPNSSGGGIPSGYSILWAPSTV